MGFLSDKILGALIFAHRKAGNVCSGSGEREGGIGLREDVAKIKNVARGQVVIHAQTKLIGGVGFGLRGDVGIGPDARRVGKRIEGQQRL